MRTFTNDGKTYSVDMLLSYVNFYKPKIITCNVNEFMDFMSYKGWRSKGKKISPFEVINNKDKYKTEYKNILKADLSYPILVNGKIVIDGMHRISKCILNGIRTIKVHVISNSVMNKCRLKDRHIEPFELIDKFMNNFVK